MTEKIVKEVLKELEKKGVNRREIEHLCWEGYHISEIIEIAIQKARQECEKEKKKYAYEMCVEVEEKTRKHTKEDVIADLTARIEKRKQSAKDCCSGLDCTDDPRTQCHFCLMANELDEILSLIQKAKEGK